MVCFCWKVSRVKYRMHAKSIKSVSKSIKKELFKYQYHHTKDFTFHVRICWRRWIRRWRWIRYRFSWSSWRRWIIHNGWVSRRHVYILWRRGWLRSYSLSCGGDDDCFLSRSSDCLLSCSNCLGRNNRFCSLCCCCCWNHWL